MCSVQCVVCSVQCGRSLADIALAGGLSPKEEEEQGVAQGKAGRMEKVGRTEGWQMYCSTYLADIALYSVLSSY